MKIVLSLCCVLLAMLLPPVASKNERGPSFRIIDIQKRDIGYSYFDSMAITSSDDFDAFLRETSQQIGWNNRQQFEEALLNAQLDFNQEALVLLRHNEGSGSVQVSFETPVLQDKTLLCAIRGKPPLGLGTADMAYYCFALVVSKLLVNQVQLNAAEGGFSERPLPPIHFSLTERQPLKFLRQDPPPKSPPLNCPKLNLACPKDALETGKTYVVRLRVEGVNPDDDATCCNWSVSTGQIVEGQGTRSLKIRIDDPSKEVTATVEVRGIDPYCNRLASCSFGR
jgi:hypothetical protein